MGKYAPRSKKPVLFWTLWAVVNAGLVLLLAQTLPQIKLGLSDVKSVRLREAAGAIFTTDLDNNGHDEIIAISLTANVYGQKSIAAFSPFRMSADKPFSYVWDNALFPGEAVARPQDVNGDEKNEAVLIRRTETSIIVRTINETNDIVEIPLPYPDLPFHPGTFVDDPEFVDINGDGAIDMVAVLKTGFEKEPRGIVAYDLEKRKLLWAYPTGCYPHQLAVADLDGDRSRPEIIFSGWAPHNNYAANGTDDDTSYLFIFDADGRVLDKKIMGGYYSKIFFDVGDIDGDNVPEIVTSRSCHRLDAPDPGEIKIYDWKKKDFRLQTVDRDAVFTGIFILPIKEQSNSLLVVGDSLGRVTLFNHLLEPVRRTRLKAPAIVLGTGKLGPNTDPSRIFVSSGFSEFSILAPDLKTEFRFPFKGSYGDPPLIYAPLSRETVSAGVLNIDGLYLVSKERSTTGQALSALWTAQTLPLALLLLSVNLLAYLARRPKSGEESDVRPILPETVQELTHKMKNPLFTIGLEAERLRDALAGPLAAQADEGARAAPGSILEDVQKLKMTTRMLMKMSESREPSLEDVDLNRLLREIGERYRALLKGRMEILLNLDDEPVQARLDPRQIEEALSNIIENAVEAVPDRGTIKISSTVVFSPGRKSRRTVEIEIEDNGRGIPEDKLEEIFKPYFTTKKDGSGIGLPIARRIIETHGGRIEVQSRMGAGTRFAVYLPASEK